ncbi:MAG: DUF4062 domain-containing protein, partial [Armatimonadetes bacterium]|nr:DUF4062 domain-containing protein [Armatimonadota bacterium]
MRRQAPLVVTQPVFVCSTFRDMQAERDILHDRVFPAVRDWVRREGLPLRLEFVDLRWEVDPSRVDVSERELEVLGVCFREIVESRPFFIGLLGDRYGSVPDADRARAVASEHGYDQDVGGHSVTALEIEFGVLRN